MSQSVAGLSSTSFAAANAAFRPFELAKSSVEVLALPSALPSALPLALPLALPSLQLFVGVNTHAALCWCEY